MIRENNNMNNIRSNFTLYMQYRDISWLDLDFVNINNFNWFLLTFFN